MADNAAKQLEVWSKTGLPECYKGRTPLSRFKSSLYDWYADLPWEKEGSIIAIQHILDNHGKTLDLVQKAFKFDMRRDLQKGLKEASS